MCGLSDPIATSGRPFNLYVVLLMQNFWNVVQHSLKSAKDYWAPGNARPVATLIGERYVRIYSN